MPRPRRLEHHAAGPAPDRLRPLGLVVLDLEEPPAGHVDPLTHRVPKLVVDAVRE
jgi:hypothetical protein